MKNVYVMLPLIEAPDSESVNRKELYPEVGRYIVHLPNDDVFVVDIYGMPEGQEYVNYNGVCLGQPRLVPEEELVLAGEVETVREELTDEIEEYKKDLEAAEKRRQDDLALLEKQYRLAREQTEEEHLKALEQIRVSEQSLAAAQVDQAKASFLQQQEKLEHEYQMKSLQLEQEVPKRFAQGEWVSGRTLKDIIALLAKDNP